MIPNTVYIPSSGSITATILGRSQDRHGYICETSWGSKVFIASESLVHNIEEHATSRWEDDAYQKNDYPEFMVQDPNGWEFIK